MMRPRVPPASSCRCASGASAARRLGEILEWAAPRYTLDGPARAAAVTITSEASSGSGAVLLDAPLARSKYVANPCTGCTSPLEKSQPQGVDGLE